jgi:hypothetical protein
MGVGGPNWPTRLRRHCENFQSDDITAGIKMPTIPLSLNLDVIKATAPHCHHYYELHIATRLHMQNNYVRASVQLRSLENWRWL